MNCSVSSYELNEDINENKRSHGEQVKFLSATHGSGVDQVDGHLGAKEISLQLPDEQHVRVHKRLNPVQKLTLWVMLLVLWALCAGTCSVFSVQLTCSCTHAPTSHRSPPSLPPRVSLSTQMPPPIPHLTDAHRTLLTRIYNEPGDPGAFGGVERLYRSARL